MTAATPQQPKRKAQNMADKNQRAHARAILNAAAVLTEPESNETSGDVITISPKMPRIEVVPRADMASKLESMPPSAEVLDLWNAGVRVSAADSPNVIEIFDVIGYDFWTGGGITTKTVSDQLKEFNGQDVEVQINSPGGDMFEGIGIYNALVAYSGKVTVKVMALAASAASVIAMAGKEIQIGQGAFIMIHNCWVLAMGNRHDMQEVANYLAPFDEALAGIYVKRTGEKVADVSQMMDDETFLPADKAIELGFADKTIASNLLIEDKNASARAAAVNGTRKIEAMLTKQGMTRSQARAEIKKLKAATLDADGSSNSGMLDAAAGTTHDAGNDDWIKAAQALSHSLKSK